MDFIAYLTVTNHQYELSDIRTTTVKQCSFSLLETLTKSGVRVNFNHVVEGIKCGLSITSQTNFEIGVVAEWTMPTWVDSPMLRKVKISRVNESN